MPVCTRSRWSLPPIAPSCSPCPPTRCPPPPPSPTWPLGPSSTAPAGNPPEARRLIWRRRAVCPGETLARPERREAGGDRAEEADHCGQQREAGGGEVRVLGVDLGQRRGGVGDGIEHPGQADGGRGELHALG